MQKFLNLEKAKQDAILNGVFATFAKSGYGKTSVADVAKEVGVSKALIFHYFGTKKNLYMFAYSYGSDLLTEKIIEEFDGSKTDFFDRILMTQKIKLRLMMEYPEMFQFITSAFLEESEEVKADVKKKNGDMYEKAFHLLFDGIDHSRFKDGITVEMVSNMVVWIGEGYTKKYIDIKTLDEMIAESERYLGILKNAVYKEAEA